MDRFIEAGFYSLHITRVYLKSNMDRFIAKAATLTQIVIMYLKSNMDRFIDINCAVTCFGKNI